ncbi:MAG: hypothetical protein LQ345_003855 [Seirophora villosa]|nr:MAG: hypothetical protein LQ345_003855 [Seirophora villosa]
MPKQSTPPPGDGNQSSKRRISTAAGIEAPRKKAKHLLAEDSSTQSDDSTSKGALSDLEAVDSILTVNRDFARRFEHNKRREELQKLEEKYGTRSAESKLVNGTGDTDDIDSSSDSEEEDDEGILASGELDEQFQATLTAIRAKDPRVYDHRTAFYTSTEDNDNKAPISGTSRLQEKPMFLSDYHRKIILEGMKGVDQDEQLPTYTEEQNHMKASIIQEINADTNGNKPDGHCSGNSADSEDEAEGDFLIPKTPKNAMLDQRLKLEAQTAMPDVEGAERDPEKYLSDFMTARAWVPQPGSRFQPFESDDDEEEQRADEFEEAYNLRFDDSASNEKLVSHARDTAARYSVRREALTGRKKSREIEKEKREVERLNREEEKARLRKLRIAAAEEKMQKIKDAAGLKNEHLNVDKWSKFLEDGWDEKQWDKEMRKNFGEPYYADQDADEHNGVAERKTKIKKPKWKDDIDIQDLIPDFEEEAQTKEAPFHLSDIDDYDNAATDAGADDEYTTERTTTAGRNPRKKPRLREQKDLQKQARNERRQIEQLVDQSINVDSKIADMGPKHRSTFRYRETSPIAYGLTPQDILLASDSQLNQYAGLKKLAAFRDSAKKIKDHKRLGKKARLRQWRKETFGNEQGPQQTLADVLAGQGTEGDKAAAHPNFVDGTRHKKRPRSKPSGIE